ncbi:MAG: HAD-IA family hydrolase [Chloroflexi bacterium]|nr:HAD-IA family hydrolase [Chloroflexota bacterium]
MENGKVKAIIYDAGLTLIGPDLSIEEVSALICARQGIEADLDAIRRALSAAQEQFISAQREDRHIWAREEAIRQLWTDYYATALRQSGVEAPPAMVRRCAEAVYDEYAKPEYWRAYQDVEGTLAEGQQRGYVQGVVSDWGVQLPAILHNLGLTRYLDFVVVSSLVGVAKPNPQIFEFALARARVRPHEALYVGDSYRTDIIGARVAGLAPVLIDRDGLHGGLDCPVVRSLGEVLNLLNGDRNAEDRRNASGS